LPAALVDWQDGPAAEPADSPPASATPQAAAEPFRESIGNPESRSEAPVEPDSISAAWRPGDSVRHPRYGVGVVTAVSADTIEGTFGKFGTRSFPLALCPLVPVPS
jgi:hypothetical protein